MVTFKNFPCLVSNPFIPLMAMVAAWGVAYEQKPKPLDALVTGSVWICAEMIWPNGWKCARKSSFVQLIGMWNTKMFAPIGPDPWFAASAPASHLEWPAAQAETAARS